MVISRILEESHLVTPGNWKVQKTSYLVFNAFCTQCLNDLARRTHFKLVKKNKYSFLEINAYKKPLRVKIWRTDIKEHAKIDFL